MVVIQFRLLYTADAGIHTYNTTTILCIHFSNDFTMCRYNDRWIYCTITTSDTAKYCSTTNWRAHDVISDTDIFFNTNGQFIIIICIERRDCKFWTNISWPRCWMVSIRMDGVWWFFFKIAIYSHKHIYILGRRWWETVQSALQFENTIFLLFYILLLAVAVVVFWCNNRCGIKINQFLSDCSICLWNKGIEIPSFDAKGILRILQLWWIC